MKPILAHLARSSFNILPVIIWVAILFCHLCIPDPTNAQSGQKGFVNDDVFVSQIDPDKRGGNAYKLVYLVGVPIDVYWRFKTDFDNDFLTGNKYIRKHNFIKQNGNTFITEDKYTHGPNVFFRWQTTVYPQTYRLDFVLLNPKQCGQKFHYGYIQLEPIADRTRVTQVAYFDFWGASLWANSPWRGGMHDFLSYTANWEQETVLNLENRYSNEPNK